MASAAPMTGSTPLSVNVNALGVDFPRICVGVYNCASKPKSVRIYRRRRCVGHCWPRSPSFLHNFSMSPALIRPTAPPKCRRTVQRLHRHQHCQPHMPLLHCHQKSSSHCPTSAMWPLASLLPLPPLSPLSSPSPLWPPPSEHHAVCSHLPHSAAQVQAGCSAVVPAPALSAMYTHTSSPSHSVIASPRPGNGTSCVTVTTATVIAIASVASHYHQGITQRRTQPMGQRHCAAGSSGGTRTPSGALQKGSGDDCHCGFEMEGTYCVQHYICILLINTNNTIYIFDVNGGKERRVCLPSLTASNSKLASASAAKGGAHAAVLLGTNMALVEILTPHGVGGTNRKFLISGKFLVSGRPGPRSCHWNTRLAGIAGIKGDRSLG